MRKSSPVLVFLKKSYLTTVRNLRCRNSDRLLRAIRLLTQHQARSYLMRMGKLREAYKWPNDSFVKVTRGWSCWSTETLSFHPLCAAPLSCWSVDMSRWIFRLRHQPCGHVSRARRTFAKTTIMPCCHTPDTTITNHVHDWAYRRHKYSTLSSWAMDTWQWMSRTKLELKEEITEYGQPQQVSTYWYAQGSYNYLSFLFPKTVEKLMLSAILSLPLFLFVRGEVLPATSSLPHLTVFSTVLCLLSSSSLPPLLPSSHIS